MEDMLLEKMLKMGEEYFGTQNDPNQMPISKESYIKIQKLHPSSLVYRLQDGEPVGWVVVLPTSKKLMNEFILGTINEKQLLDLSEPAKQYEALYLCAAFVVPEYRRKGLAVEMFKEAVENVPQTSDSSLFAWIFSEEGEKLSKKLEEIFHKKIFLKP